MLYAITVLRQRARNYSRAEILKDHTTDCLRVASALENNMSITNYSSDVIEDLKDVLNSVNLGLNGWGDGSPNEKKRQLKRQRELNEAINFLNNQLCN